MLKYVLGQSEDSFVTSEKMATIVTIAGGFSDG
jgi:hypothetical protein